VQAILRGERVRAAQIMYAHITTVRDEYEHYSETIWSLRCPRRGGERAVLAFGTGRFLL